MSVEMVALKAFAFAGRSYAAGEVFHAKPVEALAHKYLRRAACTADLPRAIETRQLEPEPAEPADPDEPSHRTRKRRRQYTRRDLQPVTRDE